MSKGNWPFWWPIAVSFFADLRYIAYLNIVPDDALFALKDGVQVNFDMVGLDVVEMLELFSNLRDIDFKKGMFQCLFVNVEHKSWSTYIGLLFGLA